MDREKLMKSLKEDTLKIETSHRSVVISKIANNMDLFSIATLWIKKRKTVLVVLGS